MENTIMQTVIIGGKTPVEQIIKDIDVLFETQTVICISGQMRHRLKIKEVVDILIQKDCAIVDKTISSSFMVYYMSHPH